jgi:TolB-like protein
VLPFANLSGRAENEYLSDAMSEEIINALAALPGLKVVARTSSSAFKGQQSDVREVGRKLGVAAVVEGSVQKSGDRIRVNAQLVDVADGFNLWSARFDRQLTDVFAIQDEIAKAVASAMQARLAGGSKLVRPPTADLEAYALYIKGRDSASVWTRQRFDQAIVYYRAALDRDPRFAEVC